MKKRVSFLLVTALVLSLLAGCGGEQQPADPVPDTFTGLVLTAAPGVSVSLYSEFADGAPIPPSDKYETDSLNYYCYKDLMGAFRYKASGAGYYTVTQNVLMTQQEAMQKTVVDVTPGKKTGSGWEPASLSLYTQELLEEGFDSDISLWPQYAEAFTTPYFTLEHGDHEMTTQAQLEAFLQELDEENDRMYRFSAGTSGLYKHDIPMVIFTTEDLSAAKTVEEAAAALENGKPTVFYRAHIHGNEPAAGEAAMSVIRLLCGSWDSYLEKLNICIVPRGSPDGAQNYDRQVLGDIDPNRDNLRLRTAETTCYMRMCQLLDPEMIIDGHEYNAQVENKTLSGGDILVGMGYTNENTPEFTQLNFAITQEIFQSVSDNGLQYRYYSGYTNTANANISRDYAAKQGTVFFLLESRGIGCGLAAYPRRIVSHVISVESIFDYLTENTAQFMETVAKEKQTIIDRGAVYDSDDRIVLKTQATEDVTLRHSMLKYDQQNGQITDSVTTPKTYTQVVADRIAPTAYVIPAGESFTENVLKLMDKHGIAYTFLPEGSRVQLQQYDNKQEDCLTDETVVTFPKGAYVFCKNQVRGKTLSLLMEPDIQDLAEHSGTLVQQGMISATDGVYPIYRYIHDLNAQGFIDLK